MPFIEPSKNKNIGKIRHRLMSNSDWTSNASNDGGKLFPGQLGFSTNNGLDGVNGLTYMKVGPYTPDGTPTPFESALNVVPAEGTLSTSMYKDASNNSTPTGITTAKIEDSAVTTNKIAAQAITTAKLNNLIVTGSGTANGITVNLTQSKGTGFSISLSSDSVENSANVYVTDAPTDNKNYNVLLSSLVGGGTGNQSPKLSGLLWNPSTKNLTATTFTGDLSGTADAAKKLTTTTAGKSYTPVYFSGGIPVAITDFAGLRNSLGLGNTTGRLDATLGGVPGVAANDDVNKVLVAGSTENSYSWVRLGSDYISGKNGKYLKGTGSGSVWTEVSLNGGVTGTLPVGNGGTGKDSFTANGLLIGKGTSSIDQVPTGTSGYALRSNGSSAPSWTNSLTGFEALGATKVTASSDERLKYDIKPFVPKHSILDLDIKSYKWKSNDESSFGFIAQEVKELFPEIVHEDENGMLSIEESKLIYLLLVELKKLVGA